MHNKNKNIKNINWPFEVLGVLKTYKPRLFKTKFNSPGFDGL